MKYSKNIARKCSLGFTIMEVMVASAVSVIILGGATVALIQGLQVWQQEQIKAELNMDLELSMEHLRQDLRLSSVGIGLMAFYSTNGVDYSAISMPISKDSDNDGLLDRNTDGEIIWNQTVVYHVRPGSPDQLLRTVFDDRWTNATAADIYAQLSNVVVSTAMSDLVSCCLTGETVSSRTVFENLVDLHFSPPDAYYDGYWPVVANGGTYNWGGLILGPGTHELKFQVEGKNTASSGYRMEIDKVSLSASASEREGEVFLPINSHPAAPFYDISVSGGVATAVERGSGWSWSGNGALSMIGTGAGSSVTFDIYNDLWCDSNFRSPGPNAVSNCTSDFDSSFQASDPFISDVVVAPSKGSAWSASQVGVAGSPQLFQAPTMVTNVVYGGTNYPEITINRSGCWARFQFQRGEFCSLLISNATLLDVTTGLSTNLTFNDGDDFVYMPLDGPETTNSDWLVMYEIDKGHTYHVSFYTDDNIGDQDLDLFVGSTESDIKYLENTGSKYAPVFGAAVNGWQAIACSGATVPAFADLDGDGDFDLCIGVLSGTPRFRFYRNEGTIKTPYMVYIDPVAEPDYYANLPASSANPSPILVDLDGDGDLDFCSGYQNGSFPYCQNIGTRFSPKWLSESSLTDTNGVLMDVGEYAAPEFADIDNDDDYDLFSGADDGTIRFWENTGSVTAPKWSFVTNAYGGITNSSTRCIVRFEDMNADGGYDMIVGAQNGSLTSYANTNMLGTPPMWAPGVVVGAVAGRAAPTFINIDEDRNGAAAYVNADIPVLSYTNGAATNAIFGLSGIEVGYAKESTYLSGVFDTTMAAPVFNKLNWTQVEDSGNGWDVDVRVRSSSLSDMSDLLAIDWQDASAGDGGYFNNNTGNSLGTLPKKRYVQYEARFKCNEDGTHPEQHTNDVAGAKLRDVTIDWPGETGLCDMLVSFGRGPDCGIVSVTVDGQDFVKGVEVDMSIFKEGRTGLNSASGVLEVRPLNTGR